ncbi:hypothetical protein EZ449_03630 [Pedobacter frigidisoli]|uniref:Lipocalin-like domain-containing protein n=1 Tax=Pedobacter frigidisoli TaxID=2530455 RepID=A0A4R0P8V4_9SPHI|nr:hypothetical protein [Pedobacter frigidisoli]TCD12120.1 hypothetical protein EZ449_03630 [Pedobacter frigidisoli]
MKKYIALCLITIFVFCACKPKAKPVKVMMDKQDKIIEQQLIGEWAVVSSWKDSVLTFKNKLDKTYKQEIFPSYNTILFNAKTGVINVETYGEFGCGMAAVQNLNMKPIKWSVTNSKLHLKGIYSDYSGENSIDSFYKINRTNEVLTLTKI